MSDQKKFSATLGNVIEWYDFCLYGYFAPLLAKAFFPHHEVYVSLLYVFLTFASGYIMRPIGGIVFGHFGDLIGGRRTLYYAIYLIAIPTFFIGVLPDYHTIGIFSPVLLVTIRLLQGFSVGGQYSSALTYLREHNAEGRGARSVSIAYLGSLGGYLLASGVGSMSAYFLQGQWVWRVPFLLTLFLILLFSYCRSQLPVPSQACVAPTKAPMIILFSQYKWLLTKASLLACVGGIYYSSFFVFLITYLNVFVGLPMASVLGLNTVCLLSSGGFIFYFAQCADRYGRQPVLLLSSLSLALLIYPAFILLNTGNFWLCLLAVWLLTTANTAFMAACSTVYVELFPSEIKYTGCAIAYNIGAGVIGGFVPFFLTFLLHHWGPWFMAGVLSLSAMAAVCLIYFWIPETLTAEEVKITVE